jgi:hypothetical protein
MAALHLVGLAIQDEHVAIETDNDVERIVQGAA